MFTHSQGLHFLVEKLETVETKKTEWSPIQSVIIRVITKSDDRAAGVRFVTSTITDRIDHFTVVSLVNWPLNGSEAKVDLALIQTSLLLSCKCT